jgi:hypothetical protein
MKIDFKMPRTRADRAQQKYRADLDRWELSLRAATTPTREAVTLSLRSAGFPAFDRVGQGKAGWGTSQYVHHGTAYLTISHLKKGTNGQAPRNHQAMLARYALVLAKDGVHAQIVPPDHCKSEFPASHWHLLVECGEHADRPIPPQTHGLTTSALKGAVLTPVQPGETFEQFLARQKRMTEQKQTEKQREHRTP